MTQILLSLLFKIAKKKKERERERKKQTINMIPCFKIAALFGDFVLIGQ
jgi:hypothetical protein